MISKQIYREQLGTPIKTCMACAAKLSTGHALMYGLCEKHWEQLTAAPHQRQRNYGRGTEYQLLPHTDELDDIIFRLEYDHDPSLFPAQKPLPGSAWQKAPQYLVYAHYIAQIYLDLLASCLDLHRFDYITFPDSGFMKMEFIFLEMGYLANKCLFAKLFLEDQLHLLLLEDSSLTEVAGKRVLLLDLYRTYHTRACMDRLKLAGAGDITTVYLTGYS